MSDGETRAGRRIRVPRMARFHVLGPEPFRAGQAWFVLHGYGQLASRFLRRFRPLDDGRRLVVAPEALSRFYVDRAEDRHGSEHRVGGSWMTREERALEIEDYVAYLDRLAGELLDGVDRSSFQLRVLGFSQGAHTAARWAVLGRFPPDQLILWGAYLPPDLDPDRAAKRLSALDLVLVQGREDPYRDAERRGEQDERLRRWGVSPRHLEHAGGHVLDEELLLAIAGEES